MEEIFKNGLMPPEITDDRRKGARILIGFFALEQICRRSPQVRSDKPILFKDQRSSRPSEFQPARVAGIDGRSGLEHAKGSTRELQERNESVLHLDRMQRCFAACLGADNIAEQPQHQIHSVYGLIYERSSAIQRTRASPARARIIFRGTEPFYARVSENWASQGARLHRLFQSLKVRLAAVLKENSQLDASFICFRNQKVGPLRRDVDGFFHQNVESAASSRNALFRVQPGWAPNRH
jgi:hypothetical protein